MPTDIAINGDQDERDELIDYLESEFPDFKVFGNSSVTFMVILKSRPAKNKADEVRDAVEDAGYDPEAVIVK